MTIDQTRPVLLIISDRPFVWVGFRSPGRVVRRWVGERDSDEERAAPSNFAGDPTDPKTYDWITDGCDLSAMVDLHDGRRASGVIDALRSMRPGAGVLVITANDDVDASDIEISRRVAWTDALRGDLEGELRLLEATRRLTELRKFTEGADDVAILLHPDPDPDALASALALRALLRRDPDNTPIITSGEMTRPENRRMAELLRMRVTTVTPTECCKLACVIAVDFQPSMPAAGARPRLAVIDHHPIDQPTVAEFSDIRPAYGATATMMTEYLRLEDERRIAPPLATALLYGIKTDTDSLSRGSIAADVHAYAFLQGRADLPLLRKLERPSYSIETARAYGQGLMHIDTDEDLAATFLGVVPADDTHVLTDVADFCLGLEEVTWAVVGAIIDDRLVLSMRHLGGGEGAGALAKEITRDGGTGGGHDIMARAVLPRQGEWSDFWELDVEAGSARLCQLISTKLETQRVSRRSSRQVHPETVPSSRPE
jgi:nanoRNase/pAp phosphatase (c-di-AMP/oligoRNAs hydrolase)